MESLPEGVLIVEGQDAIVTILNRAAREIFGNLQVGQSIFKQDLRKMARGSEGPLMKIEEHPLILTLRYGTPLAGRLIRVICPDGHIVHVLTDTVPLLGKSANIIGAVSVSRDISNIRAEHEKLQRNYEREHHLAELLQRSLLQGESLEVEGFQVAAAYRPALESERVGGDFYDSFKLANSRAVVCIGDVSGKGVEAAVFTSLARDCIRAYMTETPSPAPVLRRLNRTLYAYLPEEYFVTVFLAVIDPETSTLVYASAGHDPPLIYRAQSREVFELPVSGRLAGIFPGLTYKQRSTRLYPGDILFMYTDGLAEARHEGRILGLDGLSQYFMRFIDGEPSKIIERIYEEARAFAGGSLHDDAAAILIKASNE